MFNISRKDLYQIVACARVRLEYLISLCDKDDTELKEKISKDLKIISQLATSLAEFEKIYVID